MRVLKLLSKLRAPGHNRHLAQAIWVVFKFTFCQNAKDNQQMPQSSKASSGFFGGEPIVDCGIGTWFENGCMLDTLNIDVKPRCSHVRVNFISAILI